VSAPTHFPTCCIIPSRVLRKLAARVTDEATKTMLIDTAMESERMRGLRAGFVAKTSRLPQAIALAAGAKATQEVHDTGHRRVLPGRLVIDATTDSGDASADQAFDSAGKTIDFYLQVLKRNSIDGAGLTVVSTVHYGVGFNNAFWNGQQMVYGDGDGKMFTGFTSALDVVAHELTHGVTQYTVPGGQSLDYTGLSGALNESISDVFGSVVKQWVLKETADQADWLIGAGLLGPGLGKALRSMAQPGTAWSEDDQPANMKDVDPSADPHTNSGIANRAFYLAATALGGSSWERAAPIWYQALATLKHDSVFRDMRQATLGAAEKIGADAMKAVAYGWDTVGVV
jgi:Zn-dependent metalloprotease